MQKTPILTTSKFKELFQAGKTSICEFYSDASSINWPMDSTKILDLIDFYVAHGISQNNIHIVDNNSLLTNHPPGIRTVSETIIQRENAPRSSNLKTNWVFFQKLNISDPKKVGQLVRENFGEQNNS